MAGVIVGLAYLGITVLAFREALRLWVREFGDLNGMTVAASVICALFWWFGVPLLWLVLGPPTWYASQEHKKFNWTALENWAKKKEDA